MTYIIQDKQTFKAIQAVFQQCARQKKTTSAEHIFYNIIRGKPLTHGFTCVTNANKLKHGMKPYHGYDAAKSMLRWHIGHFKNWSAHWGENILTKYKDLITDEQLAQINEVLK